LSDTVIDGKKATVTKKFTDEVIQNLFDYRDDEDINVKRMSPEQYEEIAKVLQYPDNIENLI